MKHLEIGGHPMPALGLGTFQLEGETCREAVRHALEIGYRHIDTAQIYGNEEQVGRALKQSGLDREEVFLTTKVWRGSLSRREVRRTSEGSLRRLGTSYVDLLLIHWPNPEVPVEESLEALEALRDEGKARVIGVSNFPPALLTRALAAAPVACNQVEYHPYLAQTDLLGLARAHGLALTAYCPLAQGKLVQDPVLADIAAGHGKTAAQVALRWLLEQEPVAALPRSSDPGHRRANFQVFDFELNEAERTRIDALARGDRVVNPPFAPDW